jgi:hypothetical protein
MMNEWQMNSVLWGSVIMGLDFLNSPTSLWKEKPHKCNESQQINCAWIHTYMYIRRSFLFLCISFFSSFCNFSIFLLILALYFYIGVSSFFNFIVHYIFIVDTLVVKINGILWYFHIEFIVHSSCSFTFVPPSSCSVNTIPCP